eukprot:COSAG02_NODE_10278_length_1979_cov_3.678191_2_plen_213_part_00
MVCWVTLGGGRVGRTFLDHSPPRLCMVVPAPVVQDVHSVDVLSLLLSLLSVAAVDSAVEMTDQYGVAYRLLGATCNDDGGTLGDSGASSVAECQSFCSVDPRCVFVTYRQTQCSWSTGCSSRSPPADGIQSFEVANRTVPGPSLGWFWASTDGLDLAGHSRAATTVLASGNMSVGTAMDACAALPSCSRCLSCDVILNISTSCARLVDVSAA